MTGLLIIGIILLIGIIVVQIGKVTELAAKIRGREAVELQSTQTQAFWLVVFMVVFLVLCIGSSIYYKNMMLGYGPLISASEHGGDIDYLFNVTLFFTGIVFVLTHIALFWFAYKYRKQEGRVPIYFVHSNKLEAIWTIIPAVVMVILVVQSLVVWNDIMPDVGPDDEFIEIEATGYQFGWDLRYPGNDGLIGTKNFKLIDPASNPIGQDWTDEKNIDDFHATEIVLPVGQKVRVRITSKDVLHAFYLPHFRVKMDAIPGLPTYFIFTPTLTTEAYRENLANYPEWNVPYDAEDPSGPTRAEAFNFELACAELCGTGHWSMKKVVRIVTEEEFLTWTEEQNSFFKTNIRGTEADPYGRLLGYEIEDRAKSLLTEVESALILDDPSEEQIRLTNLYFDTGSAELHEDSNYELDNIVTIMKDYDDMEVELSGHTDSTGDSVANQILSEARSNAVVSYLLSKGIDASRLQGIGYGADQPADTNETPEGRQNNRRIEMKIISTVL